MACELFKEAPPVQGNPFRIGLQISFGRLAKNPFGSLEFTVGVLANAVVLV
jgi:hypothetical protein